MDIQVTLLVKLMYHKYLNAGKKLMQRCFTYRCQQPLLTCMCVTYLLLFPALLNAVMSLSRSALRILLRVAADVREVSMLHY